MIPCDATIGKLCYNLLSDCLPIFFEPVPLRPMLQLLLGRLLEDIKGLVDVKVPIVDLAGIFDEVGPPVLASQLISQLDTLDDRLGRFRRWTCTRDHPSA